MPGLPLCMKSIRSFLLSGILALSLLACVEDRKFVLPDNVVRNLRPGILRINEVFPSGNGNSLDSSDWIEIWNSSDTAVEILADQFLTGDKPDPSSAYASMRNYRIPPKGFFLIRFQNGGLDAASGFMLNPESSLSLQGEFAGIWFAKDGDTIVLDSMHFPASPDPLKSYGSLPDGGAVRRWLDKITPATSNNENLLLDGQPFTGRLIINEIAPNELPDWVEIVNPYTEDILLRAGEWFFSDDPLDKTKDTLKSDFLIPAGAYRLLECDPITPVANRIQLSFKLSSTIGESIGIYYKKPDGTIITISEQGFPGGSVIPSGSSYARKPDINGPFEISSTQSPGLPNL